MRLTVLSALAALAATTSAQTCISGADLNQAVFSVPNIAGYRDFTIESWVRHKGDNSQVLAWFDVGNLKFDKAEGWIFSVWQSRKGGTATSDKLTCPWTGDLDYSYYHVAASVKGNVRSIYINGQILKGCKAGTNNPSQTYYADGVGGMSTNSKSNTNKNFAVPGRWIGFIGEVRVWSVARAVTDIQKNMRRRILKAETGLVAAWDFEKATIRPYLTIPDVTGKFTGTFDRVGTGTLNSECTAQNVAQVVKDLEEDPMLNNMFQWADKHSHENCSATDDIEANCADLLQGFELETFSGVDHILVQENVSCKTLIGVGLAGGTPDSAGCATATAKRGACGSTFFYNSINKQCKCLGATSKCTEIDQVNSDQFELTKEQDEHFGTPKAGAAKVGVAAIRFSCKEAATVNFQFIVADRTEKVRGKFNVFVDDGSNGVSSVAIVDSVDSMMFNSSYEGAFVEAGAHTLMVSERAPGSIISSIQLDSDLYNQQFSTVVSVVDSIVSRAVLDLNARGQVGSNVYDTRNGMFWGAKAPIKIDGVEAWNLDNSYLTRRDAGKEIKITQHYTHVYWVKWRASDRGWRTGFRGNSDHCLIVRSGRKDMGMYANRNGGFRDSRYNIAPNQWRMVVVTANARSDSSVYGTSNFFVGTKDTPPVARGKSDRTCAGTKYYRLAWPGQGLGKVARVLAFDYELTQPMINKLWEETNPFNEVYSPSKQTQAVVEAPRPPSLSHPCTFGLSQDMGYLKNDMIATKNQFEEMAISMKAANDANDAFKASTITQLQDTKTDLTESIKTSLASLTTSIKDALTASKDSDIADVQPVDCSDCDDSAEYKHSIKTVDNKLLVNVAKGQRLQVFNGKPDEVLTATEIKAMVKTHVQTAFANALDELE